MALSGPVLAALMKSNIEALTDFPTTGQNPVVVDPRVLQAISNAIVSHITSAAVVPPGISVTTPDTINGFTTSPGSVT